MARKKRVRFAELETMGNVVLGRCGERDWFDTAFGLECVVSLELGCGRGEYTLVS